MKHVGGKILRAMPSWNAAMTCWLLLTQLNANGSIDCDKDFASELLSDDQYSQSYTEVSCLYPWRWTAQGGTHGENSLARCGSNNLWHPLRHAPLVAIKKAAARDRHLFPGSGSLEDLSHPNDSLQDYSNIFQAEWQKTNNPEDEDTLINHGNANDLPSESLRPYLCTGFDMYLV